MMNFSKLLATAVKVASLSLEILFNWQQSVREFVSNICSPDYSNDRCQSWWISVCIIDLKIWERERQSDRLRMHHWRNSLVLWANPLGALIRIKCLSHLFSVADRNNDSLNIVFQMNPSPSWPERYSKIAHIIVLMLQQSTESDRILNTCAKEDGQRLNKSKKEVNRDVLTTFSLRAYGIVFYKEIFWTIESFWWMKELILCELCNVILTLVVFICSLPFPVLNHSPNK